MADAAAHPWRLSFSGWSPRPPEDQRSPWAYLSGVTEASTFPTLDAAIQALECAAAAGVEDEIRPLFWPLRELNVTD